MKAALDLVEAGSPPHRHSQAAVVVDDAQEAEAELSFFDYQLQSYIGESGLSPQPFFFPARKRTLADGRAGYVVGPEVTRFLRRDARFGVASRESRLGDVRCKVRTYVEAKGGPISVAFATPPRDGAQREGPDISLDAGSPPPAAPFAVSIGVGGAESSGRPALDVSIALEKRREEPAGLGTTAVLDGRQGEGARLGAVAPSETSRERMASSTPEMAATAGGTTLRAEPNEFSWMWVSVPLAIGLLILLGAVLTQSDSRTMSLKGVDRNEARRDSMDRSQQEFGVQGIRPKEKAPAAVETRPNIAALPAAPVVLGPAGPCGGVTLASLRSRTASPLSTNEECALQARVEFRECENCPTMVVVPAGSFTMGSPASEFGESNEHPPHKVTIRRPFAVGKFEVSYDEWDACVADGGCGGYKPEDYEGRRGHFPVTNVSWNDAHAYASWLSRKSGKTYRLLNDAEWEYSARSGTTTPFWWGASISSRQANYGGNYAYNGGEQGKKTLAVDSFAPNPFGLHNVHGNVWELVEDCWHYNYKGAPTDGSAWTRGADCSRRVSRGGAYHLDPSSIRAAVRTWNGPDYRDNFTGFRLARTLTP